VLAGGEGWGSDQVRDAVAASGVPTRVLRPGYLPDSAVAPFFRRAAVVAYPSLDEGFGLNALEALACGAPLVTTTGSALDEVVGDAALTADPEDIETLSWHAAAALTDQKLRAALIDRGLANAGRFHWDRTAREMVGVYQEVAARAA